MARLMRPYEQYGLTRGAEKYAEAFQFAAAQRTVITTRTTRHGAGPTLAIIRR